MPRVARALRRAATAGIALCVVFALTPSSQALAASYPEFTFHGAGWGHGIGLSQWGAKGYAEHGRSWDWIVLHYFPGSYLSSVSEKTVRVNLDREKAYRSSWTLSPPTASDRLRIGASDKWGSPGESFTFTAVGTAVYAAGDMGHNYAYTTAPGSPYVISTDAFPDVIRVEDACGYYTTTGKLFRGDMEITAASGAMKLVNVLGMDWYVRGVLPGEVSASWPVDALRAQAVAARSYAYVSSGELYCTTWSQVYLGYSYEAAATNLAVQDTGGQVVKHAASPRSDKVVQTFFHSSSGGHTADIEDIWPGTGQPSHLYPYYAGVSDPYCEAGGSPNDPWPTPVERNGLQLAAALAPRMSGEPAGAGSSVWVESLSIDRADSGFVIDVDVEWSNGAWSYDVAASVFRIALGLKNTKFYLDTPYERVAEGDRYSTAVAVSQRLFPSGAGVTKAVIACGEEARFPDAVTAAGLGGVVGGPVLLVRSGDVDNAVLQELARLGIDTAYIVGGTAAISTSVESAIDGVVGETVRLAGNARYGTDRYGTAASVATEMVAQGADPSEVLIASGEVWMDAVVAGYVAAGAGRPILLATAGELPVGTSRALQDLGATSSVVFGGPVRIGDDALASLLAITGETSPAKRFGTSGSRYDVSAQVAAWTVSDLGFTIDAFYVVTGEACPDSITGGVLAGAAGNPMLSTTPNSLQGPVSLYLDANGATIERFTVIGGEAAVAPQTVEEIVGVLR